MSYTVSQISKITSAVTLQLHEDALIEHLLLDSRKLLFPSGTLFFALSGPRRNGLQYIKELYQNGVRNFVVDENFDTKQCADFPQSNIVQVKDVHAALQEITGAHRNRFSYPVIGITGSNGKTIIKEWLFQLLNGEYHIVRSPKSYNSQIGVPLSVWQMNAQHSLGIFEAGISEAGEMKRLQKIINPDIGVLGYIGDAHAEGFENIHQKISEKLQLFTQSKTLVYCEDDSMVKESVVSFVNKINNELKLFSWSRKNKDAIFYVAAVEKNNSGSLLKCFHNNLEFSITVPFADEASLFNAISCCCVMLHLGVSVDEIQLKIKTLRQVEMRLELKQGLHQCSIINDSYSNDINSLGIALDFLSQQEAHQKKTVILSDVLQSGYTDDFLYNEIADILKRKKLYRFIGIGPRISAHAHFFQELERTIFFPTTEDFIKHLTTVDFFEETILLKGARIFEFEKISSHLEQKIHETVLEINLNAIRSNLKLYRSLLGKEVKLMAMVKAFSYGSGSHEIAGLLQHEGVDYLAVAYADEGVELRQAGIKLPIMVMNATEISFDNLIQYNLEPEIYSFDILHSFNRYLLNHNIKDYPIHIKLDTGMHRLGFMQSDIGELCDFLNNNNLFHVKSVFSHLVASENHEQDEYTQKQSEMFLSMSEEIEKTLDYGFIKHIANTSAIHRHPSLQFDMVRLGIGLYGVDETLSLQNVTTLKTTIAQIKKLKKGDTVGYGRKGVLYRDSLIATVRIGYADGYPRILGNGTGKMLVNGMPVPVIGNVCMDMTMLDITDIAANEGDEVIVFGEHLSVKTIASWAGTIPYEILTSISQRVKRVYFEE